MVDLVIVNYNSAAKTLRAIASARSEHENIGRIIVVENGTGEADAFRDYETVVFETNRGFAAGVNAGMGASDRDVLLLNPDTWLLEGPWKAFFEMPPRVAVKGPRILSPDGSVQASIYGEPSAVGVILEFCGVQRMVRRLGIRRRMPDRVTDVPVVQGSALLISRAAWNDVGPFDEEFFLYHEEADWCLRARDKGYRVLYDPSVSIVHEGGVDVPRGREDVYYRGAMRLIKKRQARQ